MAKFQKGNCANPNGRPKGQKDPRTALRELFKPHAPELIQTAIDLALAGDMTALRLCLDRCCPVLKPQTEPAATALPTTGSLSEQAAAIYQAVNTGEISTDDATSLMGLVQSQCRIKELSELEARLTALELKGDPNHGDNKK